MKNLLQILFLWRGRGEGIFETPQVWGKEVGNEGECKGEMREKCEEDSQSQQNEGTARRWSRCS